MHCPVSGVSTTRLMFLDRRQRWARFLAVLSITLSLSAGCLENGPWGVTVYNNASKPIVLQMGSAFEDQWSIGAGDTETLVRDRERSVNSFVIFESPSCTTIATEDMPMGPTLIVISQSFEIEKPYVVTVSSEEAALNSDVAVKTPQRCR